MKVTHIYDTQVNFIDAIILGTLHNRHTGRELISRLRNFTGFYVYFLKSSLRTPQKAEGHSLKTLVFSKSLGILKLLKPQYLDEKLQYFPCLKYTFSKLFMSISLVNLHSLSIFMCISIVIPGAGEKKVIGLQDSPLICLLI